jgi:hypothetical protein
MGSSSEEDEQESATTQTQVGGRIKRIGILQCIASLPDDSALRYLILSINTLQTAFQVEFIPFDSRDEFLVPLLTDSVTKRPDVASLESFYPRARRYFRQEAGKYDQHEDPPDCFLVISNASFEDNYFYASIGAAAVIAIGGWKRSMAPPSEFEFIQILLLESSLHSLCGELHTHMGTRGCLMDFSAVLSDVRQKVLVGVICQSCESVLREHGYPNLAEDLRPLLSRKWLGSTVDPASPAAIVSKLGYDLFITKGLKPNLIESVRTTLVQEGVKQILYVIAALLVAIFIGLIGIAALNVHVSSTTGDVTRTPSPTSQTQP